MEKKYAIQGFEGSFHQEAAQRFFNNTITTIHCTSFSQTFLETKKKEVSGAVVAIENSIAGSILPNYSLLQKSNLFINGEIYLPIKQHLMVNKGIGLSDIKEVHSHPMAILQCNDFLQKHHFKIVETEDTALSAKFIKQHHCKHIAAIAGSMAAQLYNLDIIAPNIQTEKTNSTRFLILEKKPLSDDCITDKASLYFETTHQQGSLAQVLTAIANRGINVSKLQSFPVSNNPFHYYFHIDLEFTYLKDLEKAIEHIKKLTVKHKLYGIYKGQSQSNQL
jgi:prephenate dehydratase